MRKVSVLRLWSVITGSFNNGELLNRVGIMPPAGSPFQHNNPSIFHLEANDSQFHLFTDGMEVVLGADSSFSRFTVEKFDTPIALALLVGRFCILDQVLMKSQLPSRSLVPAARRGTVLVSALGFRATGQCIRCKST